MIGIGGINAPSYVYVSRWFDRRRGSALALISSGSFLAGAIWPSIFERAIAYAGWRHTMLFYAAIELVLIVPAAAIVLANPPDTPHHATVTSTARTQNSVLGWPANLVFTLQMCAIFTCCVPMSMPQAHLVAFCSDLGISPVHGAAMLSVLLGSAFLSRQVWGALSDRIGGLYTMLVGSACQTLSLSAFMFTQDELGLFTVSALFGFGFSGLVPANVLASRELFPVGEAYWRIPTLLLCSGTGMAAGGLDRRHSLRPLRLLRAGLCHRRRRQCGQFHDHHGAGVSAQPNRAGVTLSAQPLRDWRCAGWPGVSPAARFSDAPAPRKNPRPRRRRLHW